MSESSVFDLAVIGAGIVGAATAHEFLNRHPGASVVVLEKESLPAQHQTSHNSGVIHAGVYYKPGSLKARLCIEGHRRMVDFCEHYHLPYRVSGKLIVAVDESELDRLETLRERSIANGIANIEQLPQTALREIEPYSGGIAALHIPSTAITDYGLVTKQLIKNLRAGDAEVLYSFAVVAIDAGSASTEVRSKDGRTIRAKAVVACTGTQADRTQRLVEQDDDFSVLPFRGAYYDLKPSVAAQVQSMIYPVPDPRFPFLGVHLTRHIDDTVSCGPNAVLSPARSGHHRFSLTPRDLYDALRFPGTWVLARKYWRECGGEALRDISKRRFAAAAQRYLPGLQSDDLVDYHFGIRAQAITRAGALVDDFNFSRVGNTLFVRNAPSPAATASLSIATYIVDQLEMPA